MINTADCTKKGLDSFTFFCRKMSGRKDKQTMLNTFTTIGEWNCLSYCTYVHICNCLSSKCVLHRDVLFYCFLVECPLSPVYTEQQIGLV